MRSRVVYLLLLFFVSLASAKGFAGTDDIAHFDQHRLDKAIYDFYIQTKGPTNWPPQWRTRWGNPHPCSWDGREANNRPPFGTRCVNGGWHVLPPVGDGGLMFLDHQSGMAEGPVNGEFMVAQMLDSFNVHGNKLNGPIWNTSYHNFLHRLDLSSNRFSGTLGDDFLQRCTIHAETVNLGMNQFSGNLPRSLTYLTSLIALLFNDNQFEGSIPDMGKLTRMSHLYLSNNKLSGTLGNWLGDMKRLAWVELDNNMEISGPFPTLPPSVTRFSASNTKLSGMLPASYGLLPRLRYFICKGCDVQCPTPDLLAHLHFSTHCKPPGSRQWDS